MEKKSKLSLLADNIILYIENPKDSTRKLLELIYEFSSIVGYTMITCCFLYANNESSKREMKKTTSFTSASKRIKYLGITLPKEAKDLYSKN